MDQLKWTRHVQIVVLTLVLMMLLPGDATSVGVPVNDADHLVGHVAPPPIPTQKKVPFVFTRKHLFSDDASVYVGFKEVLRLRSDNNGLSACERADTVQKRLVSYLRQGGRPDQIKPGVDSQAIVIKADDQVLATVDIDTAEKEERSQQELAVFWTNRLRKALGGKGLSKEAIEKIAQKNPSFGYEKVIKVMTGVASWYGPKFHGRRTASGERYNMHAMTAAHKSLPFNTMVRVTNKSKGKSVVVRITDRGPYAKGRIIDLSKAAAEDIGMISSGTAPVVVEVLER